MKVFIVLIGENSEGASVEGVFLKMEDAIKFCKSHKSVFAEGWIKDSETDWHSGCDYMVIETHEAH